MYLYFWGFLVLTLIFLCLTKIKKVTKNNVIMCLSLFAIFVYIANLITVGNLKEVKTTNQKKNKHVKLSVLNNRLVLLEGYSYGDKHEHFSDVINYPIATGTSDCQGGEFVLKSDKDLSKVNATGCTNSNNNCKCYDPELDEDIKKIIDETIAWVEKLGDDKLKSDYKDKLLGVNSKYNFVLKPRQLAHLFTHTHKKRINLINDLMSIDLESYKAINAEIEKSNGFNRKEYNKLLADLSESRKLILESRLKSGYPSDEHHNVRLLLVIDILDNIKLESGQEKADLTDTAKTDKLTHRHKISGKRIDSHVGPNKKKCQVSDNTSRYHELESLDNPELRVMELWNKNGNNGEGQWLTDISETEIGKGQKLFIYLVVSKILGIPITTDKEGLKKFFVYEKV